MGGRLTMVVLSEGGGGMKKQFPICLRTKLLDSDELPGTGLPSGREAGCPEKHDTGPYQLEKAASVGPVAQKA